MDVEALLLPLAVDAHCGVSLLHEAVYDAIRLARQDDDASLPQGVWETPLKKANWAESIRLCSTALTSRSKDLQIAAWLGEAWITLDGIDGGMRTIALMHGLCARFWPDVHPLPRDNDTDFRTAPIIWADQHWSQAVLLRLPLVRGGGVNDGSYTLADWNDAMVLQNDARKNKYALAEAEHAGLPTHARIMESVASMPLTVLSDAAAGVKAWKQALLKFDLILELKMPDDAPRMGKLCSTLESVESVLQQCLVHHPKYSPASPPAVLSISSDTHHTHDMPAFGHSLVSDLSSREEAYRKLTDIANFLTGIDPHSPVPSLIWRAISWGRMPFEELMGELMANEGEMQRILFRS